VSDDDDRCNRGEWCADRTVTIENGQRIVLAAITPRAYCDGCQDHIGKCLEGAEDPETGDDNGMPALWSRLHDELPEARQAEIMVKMPFGPSLPFSEAIDAQMRAMGEILCSWEERVGDVWRLSPLGKLADRPQDSLADIERSVSILVPRISTLLSLEQQDMMRYPPLRRPPKDRDIPPGLYDGATVLSADRYTITAAWNAGGREAGQELLHLHYMARRLLMETNPPMPSLPDFRCRVCEKFTLRKASPPWHEGGEWYWSRCDACGDECTREEYDVNARRWVAYEKACRATPVLGGLSHAA
jgi:hypothetical protein